MGTNRQESCIEATKKLELNIKLSLRKGLSLVSMRGKQAKSCTLLGFRAEEGSIMIPSELP